MKDSIVDGEKVRLLLHKDFKQLYKSIVILHLFVVSIERDNRVQLLLKVLLNFIELDLSVNKKVKVLNEGKRVQEQMKRVTEGLVVELCNKV